MRTVVVPGLRATSASGTRPELSARATRIVVAAALAALALVVPGTPAAAAENLAAAYGEDWKSLPDWRGVWFLEQPLLFPGPDHAVIEKQGGG